MKIAVLSPVPATLQQVRSCLGSLDSSLVVRTHECGLDRAPSLLERDRPDLLVAEGNGTSSDLAVLETLTLRQPGIAVILIAAHPAPEFLLQAMRIGVREVLPAPVFAEALQQAVERVRVRSGAGAPAARQKGKTLAVLSCKGGSGATFIAANLAYALAQDSSRRVALIDLNLHCGEALLYIHDGMATSTVADVVAQIQRLDAEFLESSMVQILPNFGLLAAPQSSDRVGDVKPEGVDRLLNLAASQYDYVVLDVSRSLNAVALEALDHADMILPVLQLTLPFIRDAKWLISICHSLGYPDSKLKLIVNRFEKNGEITLQDVERTLGVPVFGTVPNSYQAVATSINHGHPILQRAPRDAVSKALLDLAQALGSNGAKPATGWLRGWMDRKPAHQGTTVSLAPSP